MIATRQSKSLGKQIKAQFCDGKWHRFDTIVSRTGGPAENVWSTLDRMWRWGTYETKCERKKVGTDYHFRLSPKEKQISVHELALHWQITHAASCCKSICGNGGIAVAVVEG